MPRITRLKSSTFKKIIFSRSFRIHSFKERFKSRETASIRVCAPNRARRDLRSRALHDAIYGHLHDTKINRLLSGIVITFNLCEGPCQVKPGTRPWIVPRQMICWGFIWYARKGQCMASWFVRVRFSFRVLVADAYLRVHKRFISCHLVNLVVCCCPYIKHNAFWRRWQPCGLQQVADLAHSKPTQASMSHPIYGGSRRIDSVLGRPCY